MFFSLSTFFILILAGLTFHCTHFMSTLLCLEGMKLSLFIAMALWTLKTGMLNLSSGPMLLLAFSSCEASAGLSPLAATARTHGTDHLQNVKLLQC